MKIGRALSLFLAAALLFATAQAQEKEKPKSMAGEKAMEMPKPGPEMTKWDWMAGKWNVTETHEKSEWGPGGTGKGTNVISLGPGGFSHVIVYNSAGPSGKFAGRGIMAWDPNAQVYKSVWTDNMTPGIMTMDCKEEGKVFSCTGESMNQGKKVTMRTKSTEMKPSGWTEVFETSTDGGPYAKMMTLEYKKAP